MNAPDQIVQCLDQLELVSDSPEALRLIAELRIRLHEWALNCKDLAQMQQEKIDDLVCQLEAICREPV